MSICATKHRNCPTCTCLDPVDPALVDGLLFGATPEELNKTFEQEPDLRPYGFANGDYFCKCKICECNYEGDKRSSNCHDCAIDLYQADETNNDNWDNEQWYSSGWDACEKQHHNEFVSLSVAFGKSVIEVDKLEMENAILRSVIEASGVDPDEAMEMFK